MYSKQVVPGQFVALCTNKKMTFATVFVIAKNNYDLIWIPWIINILKNVILEIYTWYGIVFLFSVAEGHPSPSISVSFDPTSGSINTSVKSKYVT